MFRKAIGSLLSRRFAATNPAQIVRAPQVEYSADGCVLDSNHGKREILLKEWVSPVSGKTFRLERAIPEDYDILLALWIKNFNETCNIVKHLETEEHEWLPVMGPMTENSLQYPISVLAFEEDKLVGSTHASILFAPDFDGRFGDAPVFGVEDPHLQIKADYAEDVASFNFTPKVNTILAFLQACEHHIAPFHPEGITKHAYLEATNVHPLYQKDGIGTLTIAYFVREAFKQQCQAITSLATAAGTTRISEKAGYNILFQFPYEHYKVDGKVMFYDLIDGAKAGSIVSIMNPKIWKGGPLRSSKTPILLA